MTKLPHDLLSKAYVLLLFMFAAIFVVVAGVLIIVLPFWIIASIFAAIIVALIGFTIWASMQPTSGEG